MMRLFARRATVVVAALALGGLTIAACGSSPSGTGSSTSTTPGGSSTSTTEQTVLPGAFGTLPGPGTGTPEMGSGVVTIAEQPGAGPTWIFPVTPASHASVFTAYDFQNYMWRPLWWSPMGATPAIDYTQSIAQKPVFSDNNKTVTITLNPNWKWSDGQPVTSKDVEFFIDLVEAAVKTSSTDYSNYTPGLFPDFITSMSTPSTNTIVLTINKTYNQNFLFYDELGLIIPLPSHAWAKTSATSPVLTSFGSDIGAANASELATMKSVFNYISSQAKTLGTYASNPLWQTVDGPFKLKSFDASDGANTMVPNLKYSGPVVPHIAELDNVAFTSIASEFNQLLTGNLTVGFVDFSDLPQVNKLKAEGYTVWGYPDYSFSYIAYNFEDKTGDFDNIIKQLYIREALAHLQDEPAIISSKGAFDGAAGQAYGPVPAVPPSPFAPANALTNPYPYSISTASQLLSSHGWKVVPNGQTTCQSPGTASNECGAGIPAGTPLSWNLIYGNSPPVIGTQDEVLASAAKQVGINISLTSDTFNYIIGNLSDASNPTNSNKWAMQDFGGFTDSLYPTTNELFNQGGSYNIGGYNDPVANQDILNSVNSLDNTAVQTEISYITAQQPGLFQPNADLIFAYKNTLHGLPASFASASQYQYSPEYWYFTS
jgi:peptide/nickel transport system substrate-binding protein